MPAILAGIFFCLGSGDPVYTEQRKIGVYSKKVFI